MNLDFFIKLLTFLQFFALSQNSHVQDAKQRIRAEVRGVLGHQHHQHHSHQPHHHRQLPPPHLHKHYHGSHWRNGQQVHRLYKWNGRRKPIDHQQFTKWTAWSPCDNECIKHRVRYCKAKRKCGHTKHVEQHKCKGCHPLPIVHELATAHTPWPPASPSHNMPQTIIINAAAASGHQWQSTTYAPPLYEHHVHVPVLEEIQGRKHITHRPKQHHAHSGIQLHNTVLPPLSEESSQDMKDTEAYDERSAMESSTENEDFYVTTKRPKFRKQPKPILMSEDDYDELVSEEQQDELDDFDEYHDAAASAEDVGFMRALHTRKLHAKPRKHKRKQRRNRPSDLMVRNLAPGDDGIDGDIFQYEDFDLPPELVRGHDTQESDSYEDEDYLEYRNSSFSSLAREKANALIPKHRRIYSKWSRWTKCSPKCTTRRYKKCRIKEQCGREVLREIAYCYTEGSFCQQWLQAQVQKSPPYELRPVSASRRRDISDATQSNNAIGGTGDFIMNGKGYHGPEYAPMKLKCGIAPIRSNKRSMYNMLKIIGGKAARRGEWPWQVAIFNRFKEAFCGGTLIAPQWVLTAAHCVRKVLYVRIGEHNLDYEDGTEIQLRVLKSFKHPNFDKKTVDSDVALLRLPKPVNATTWIGFSCLPRPYQPLPKNIECTVIGWGKRRNRDAAGTSVLHQASVPIIPMDNCRSVYQDYTITKNMFCAGHKRGRIDTCAGDSGGPLLCRDTTKPNHPWTIFGITSFGDGCAKRNKFGIYAKVPNYVDWVWSVINCNGNCKLHQRNYGN